MLTEERKAIIKERYSKGFLATRDEGIGFIEAIQQSGNGVRVYQRLGHDVAHKLDFEDRMLAALKRAKRCMTNERYLKPRLGMESEWAECDALIAEVEAYRAAEMEAIGKNAP